MFDACGMAGGNYAEVFNAGAYNATRYAKQGDLGSQVMARAQLPHPPHPPPRHTPTPTHQHTHGLAVELFVEMPR